MRTRIPHFALGCVLLLTLSGPGAAGLSSWKETASEFQGGEFSGTELKDGAIRLAPDPRKDADWQLMNTGLAPGSTRHSLVYDERHGETLLFGGSFAGTWDNSMWAYNLTANSWTKRFAANGPLPRMNTAMACDPATGLVVLFSGWNPYSGLLRDTWTYDAGSNVWTKMNPLTIPPQRSSHAMTYDSRNQQVLMFGGLDINSKELNDTWAYSLATDTWRMVSPPVSPPARFDHGLAFDGSSGRTVMFGGAVSRYGVSYTNETWSYDGTNNSWTNLTPAASPSPRKAFGMACNGAGKVFVFGGSIYQPPYYSGETWAYSVVGNEWSIVSTSPSPRQRRATAIVWDTRDRVAVLFGGEDGWFDDDTWTYDPAVNNWQQRVPVSAPSNRWLMAMAFDSTNGVTVLFGGARYAESGVLHDTWAYNTTTGRWRNMEPPSTPPGRSSPVMAYDPSHGRVVMFGGYNYTYPFWLNDTWTYDVRNNTWTNMSPPDAPSIRAYSSMTYSAVTGELVLFGGLCDFNYSGDTWTYNLTTNRWTNVTPALSPGRRGHNDIAYDEICRKVVLFGGADGYTAVNLLNDTWIYDPVNNTWTNRTPASGPAVTGYARLVYDASLGGTVIFGGTVGLSASYSNATWLYNCTLNNWTRLLTPTVPPEMSAQAIAYDSINGVVLTYGGANGTGLISSEVWGLGIRGYGTAGTYTSRPFDTGGSAYFGSISWDADITFNTSIRFQLRSSDSLSGLNASTFTGPDGSALNYFTSTGTRLPSLHNGTRYLQYRAYLGTTNARETSALRSVSIRYNLIHSVVVTSPAAGEEWNGTGFHEIIWNATDRDGDTLTYDIYATNGGAVNITLAQRQSLTKLAWMTNAVPNGRYRILVVARDSNPEIPLTVYAYSPEFGVTNEPAVPPSCRISSPPEGQELRGSVNITGTASRGSSDLKLVEFRLDGGIWQNATGTDNWTSALDTTKLSKGAHTLEARAFDGTLYSGIPIVNFTINNSRPPRIAETVTVGEFPICLVITLLALTIEGFYAAKDYRNRKSEKS